MFSAFGWLSRCWTWSCISTWWWPKARKVFVYETTEITRPDGIVMILYQRPKKTPVFVNHGHPVGSMGGWITRPANRSVVARHWYKSLYGGWREDSLWRAMMIRVFPRITVMGRRMLTAEFEMDCCLKSLNQSGEHSDYLNISVCVPLWVRFVVAIILL